MSLENKKSGGECFNVTALSVVKYCRALKKFSAKSHQNRMLIGEGQSRGLCASLATADFVLD